MNVIVLERYTYSIHTGSIMGTFLFKIIVREKKHVINIFIINIIKNTKQAPIITIVNSLSFYFCFF